MTAKKPHPKLKAAVPRGSNLWTARKGKLSGGIIAMSSAAIVAIYTLGRANTSSGSEELLGDPSIAAATATVTTPANTSRVVSPTIEAPAGGRTAPSATRSAGATASYKDGSYKGNGTSRHGDMEVTVVIKDGKIALRKRDVLLHALSMLRCQSAGQGYRLEASRSRQPRIRSERQLEGLQAGGH